jgi:hypothetical protein
VDARNKQVHSPIQTELNKIFIPNPIPILGCPPFFTFALVVFGGGAQRQRLDFVITRLLKMKSIFKTGQVLSKMVFIFNKRSHPQGTQPRSLAINVAVQLREAGLPMHTKWNGLDPYSSEASFS